MFESNIGFTDDFDCMVSVFSKKGTLIGEGKLVLSPKRIPKVEFDYHVNISQFRKNTFFKCTSQKGNFTLLSCEVMNNCIFPKVVVKGEKKSCKFKKVSVLLQGISEWMDSTGQFSITDNEISRTREKKTFKSNIVVNGKRITISNEHWCQTKHHKENEYLIINHTLISFECKSSSLLLPEVINLIQGIRTIFTLLLGFNLGVLYVLDRTDKSRNLSLYYANNTPEESNVKRKIDCFVSSSYLFENGKWDRLFKEYFGQKSQTHEDIWARVAGMFAFEGYWEYQLLAYVSLLDRYVSLFAREYDNKLSNSQFRKVCREIKSYIKEKSETEVVESVNVKVYDSIALQLQSIENSSFSSFGEKFEFKCSKTDKQILSIINLTTNDFGHLKKIRNSIAHGDSPKLKDNGDITYEVMLSKKVDLLLRYWTFCDLGFNKLDYVRFLNNWMYPITREARLNQCELDIATGNYVYLNTNKTNYNLSKKQSFGQLVMQYDELDDIFRFNKMASSALASRYKASEYNSVEAKLMSVVDTRVIKSITYLNNGYVTCNNDSFKVEGGMCVLNAPDYFWQFESINDRRCLFNDESNSWVQSKLEKRIKSLSK